MSEFLAGLAGVIIGGALSLAGVWWSLRRQRDQERIGDERGLRDREYDRVRGAYEAVAAEANYLADEAFWVVVREAWASRGRDRDDLDGVRKEPPRTDTTEAAERILRLGTENDRRVLDQLKAIRIEYFVLRALASESSSGRRVTPGSIIVRSNSIRTRASELAELARQRLADLAKPLE